MRRVRLTPEAERTLGAQIDYLMQISPGAAANLVTRVEQFLTETVALWPRAGRYIPPHDLWETWIPGTRLVVWYVFTEDEIVAVTFWHTAQDRHRS